MVNFAVILLSLSLGALFRRTGAFPEGTHRVLNALIIHVSLPALTLLHVHRLPLESRALFPILMAWILFIAGTALLTITGRTLGWSSRVTGAVVLTSALANTSFVGFPLLEALFGHHALAIGILTDQPGSFLVLSTLGVAVASALSGAGKGAGHTLRRIFTFPPFYALIAALLLSPFAYPEAAKQTLQAFSATLVPLALLSVGFQLDFSLQNLRTFAGQIAVGLLYKLLIGPALIAVLYLGAFGARGEDISISIIQAAMPPMIMGAVLATEYDLEPTLANLMVGIGIPLGLLTVPAWFWALRFF